MFSEITLITHIHTYKNTQKQRGSKFRPSTTLHLMLHLDAREEKEEETNKVLSTIKKTPNNTSQLQQLSVYLVL